MIPKKQIAYLLVVCMLMGLFPTAALAKQETSGNGIEWEVLEKEEKTNKIEWEILEKEEKPNKIEWKILEKGETMEDDEPDEPFEEEDSKPDNTEEKAQPKETAKIARVAENHDHTDGTWTELTSNDTNITSNGMYYLKTDKIDVVEPKAPIEISGKDVEVTLCLNGKTLDGSKNGGKDTGDGSVIKVLDGAKLTLCDCSGDNSGTITGGTGNDTDGDGGGVSVNKSTFIMESGTISDNTAYSSGGGVAIDNGTFEMNGGEISGNTAPTSGGGVYVSYNGIFKMNGGTISQNFAEHNSQYGGGGVHVNGGTFTMSGNSEISGNTSKNNAGGVAINAGKFTMENGEISGNTAAYIGGGVMVDVGSEFIMNNGTISGNITTSEPFWGGGGVAVSPGTFEMTGGTISDNITAGNGGGVFVAGSTFTMSGNSKISGNVAKNDGGEDDSRATTIVDGGGGVFVGNSAKFNIRDNIKITENTKDGITNNVYLSDSRNQDIIVTGELSDGAEIGVTTNIAPTETQSVLTIARGDKSTGGKYVATEADKEHFTSDEDYVVEFDNANKVIYLEGTKIPPVQTWTVTFDTDGGSAVPSQEVESGQSATEPNAPPTWAGHRFLGWFSDEALTTAYDFDTPVTEDIILYAKWEEIPPDPPETEYTVTFQSDGSTVAEKTVKKGEKVDRIAAPTKTGHQFKDWFLDLDDETPYDFNTAVTKNIILHAKWERVYEIKLEDDGNGVLSAPYKSAAAGTEIILTASPNTGYHFKEWQVVSGNVTISDNKFIMPASDVTVKAIFAQNDSTEQPDTPETKYTVTVQNEGNGIVQAAIPHEGIAGTRFPVLQDTEITLVAVPADGWTFKEWEVVSGNVTISDNKFIMPASNVTVKAIFEKDDSTPPVDPPETKYTVTFNSNGGSAIAEQKITSGESVTKPTDPTRDGYTFKGWFSDETLTNAYGFNTAVTADMTLHAKWEKIPTEPEEPTDPTEPDKPIEEIWYTVVFNTDGGSAVKPQQVRVKKGEKVARPDDPTKTGYTFKDWFLDEALTNKYDFNAAVMADMILYAKWEEIPDKPTEPEQPTNPTEPNKPIEPDKPTEIWYIVTFDTDGGSVVIPQKVAIKRGEKVARPISDPTKNGFQFVGWYTDKDGNLEYDFDAAVTENTTLYAKWKNPTKPVQPSEPTKRPSGGGGGSSSSGGRTGTWVKEEENKPSTINLQQETFTGCKRDNTCPMSKFSDLNMYAWYHDGIHYCLEENLMYGTGTTIFSPDAKTTRAMMVAILWRIENKPIVNYNMTFSDVKPNAYYAEAVRWAASVGVVKGYNQKTFAPNDSITREQMAAILYRYTKYKGKDVSSAQNIVLDYKDVNEISNYALEAMKWARSISIINGMSSTQLSPKGNATRAQVAQMLKSYLNQL